jgi:hypothetical protein
VLVRQGPGDVGFQRFLLLCGKTARTAPAIELFQARNPALVIELAPASDRIVVEIQNFGHPLAAQAIIQKQDGVRPACDPMLCGTVARQRQQFLPFRSVQKIPANHEPH